MTHVPLIYSLFPRLVGTMPEWLAHSARAAEMGFNWLLLNPLHYPGFSGSLYAVKDFYRLNPLFVPEGCDDPMEELRRTIDAMHDQGLKVMMDLVVNHTSKDSPLIKDHPEWFRRDENGYVISPSAIDPADSRKVTVWGDLAEIDNAHSTKRQELWAYWTALVQYYLDLGFDGFRCDAAYKVPAKLWQLLIAAAEKRKEGVLFVAETLGCRLAEVRSLRVAGFDYLFNSSKWWAFDQMWAVNQHREFAEIAPSISFPETHDTERLFKETGGLVQVQKQRYVLAAAFSAGLLMPVGYEFCFEKKLHVVETTPNDWEGEERSIVDFIARVNGLVEKIDVLSLEGRWKVVSDLDSPTTLLSKEDEGEAPLFLAVNKDWHQPQKLTLRGLKRAMTPREFTILRLYGEKTEREPVPEDRVIELGPAEIALVTSEELS